MKKKVLTICMLLLSFGILSSKTFAQDAPGTEGSVTDYIDMGTATPAGNYPSAPPPGFTTSLKRNNGNGHCEGSGLITLNIKGTPPAWMQLIDVAYQSNRKYLKGLIMNGSGTRTKNSFTYCIGYNIPPVNKLIFHFRWSGGDFWIGE